MVYRVDVSDEIIGEEWVAYGTGDATYGVSPAQTVLFGGATYYWLDTYTPVTADNLTGNTTIYAQYALAKPLVITADSDSYVYNGSLHTISTGTVSDPSVTVSGYTVYGGGTDVGAYPTSVAIEPGFVIMSGSEDVTYQYDVSTVKGTLTITPADMDVDSSGYDQPYDGNAHGITVTGPDGSTVKYSLTQSSDPADYTLDESPTATDYTPGTPVYFVVTDDNYNPAFGSETITIGKRTIPGDDQQRQQAVRHAPADERRLDGRQRQRRICRGEGFDPANTSATGSITNVGSTANPFDYALLAGTNPDNYAVDATEGTLTITRATDMVVTADDYSGKYDGAPHGVTAGVEVGGTTTILYSESWSSDPADYTLTGSPTLTHVGTKTVYFVALNDNYEPDFGSAQITVAPREITLTAATRTMQYDGQPLENSTVTLSGDGFVDGEGFATWPTATGSITNVGNTANVVGDGTLNTSTEAADYDFTPVDGTLTVTPAVLTVQADTLNLTYPESRPAAGTLTYTTVGGNAAGETPAFSGALSYASTLGGDPLTPDTYEDAIEAGNLALADNDAFLAGNYTLAVLTGDIVVSDGSFTVGLEGESWPYDGDPHGPTLTGSEPGDEVTYYTYDGSSWVPYGPTPPTVTNVADGPLQVKVVVTRPGYEPAEATTTLTITPADMDVDSSGYDQPYDGNAHGITVTGPDGSTVKYSLTQSSDPADYTLDESPTATDYTPGTPVYFVVTDDNYNPAFGSETITIGKRTIRVTTNSDSKPYDTLPLTNDGWTEDNDSDGFVAGEGFDPANTSATGSITNVGSTANPFDYALLAGTNPDNYAVDATEGTLTITRATDMAVTADDYSGKYDGAPHGVTAGVEVGGTTTILYSESWSSDPADYTLTGSPTLTHVGTKTVYFVALNDNYEPDFGSAQITVAPREITLTAATRTMQYDGQPLENSTVTLSGDGFVDGEGFATWPTATGSITNVGNTANVVGDGTLNTSTEAADYDFTPVDGTLTVTPAVLTVQADTLNLTYPESRPAAGTLTYTTVGGNAAGETPAFSGALSYASTLGGDPLTPDTYEDAIEAGNLALADNDAFLAGNYTLAVLTGDIVVSDGSFTVGLEGESWPYDGDPHGPTLTGSEPGDEVTYYTYDGSSWVPYGPTPPTVTNVADGPLQVKVVVTRPGYEPAEATTTLTITPADMDVDSSGYDQPYDGNAHGITVTGPDGSTVKYSLTQSSDPADYTLDESPTATDYTPGTPVYFVVTDDNYNPAFGSETITIGKRTIRVTTNSDSKPYDTLPLTNDGWTEDNDSDGFVAGEGFDPANTSATGSITNVGSTANPFDYALLAGTNPDNYAVDATEGTLTITRATDMVVTADDYSGKYDGAPHGVTAGVEVGGTTTILYSESWSSDPADYTLTGSPTLTHVGTKTVYFVALNDNYEPDFGSAQITVAPREITLTAATRTMQYDGQPLENSTVTLSGDGFVDGEGFATWPTATGSITNVGNTANVVGDGTLNTSTEAADYDFTPVDGTLTVTPAVLTVQADTLNLTYPESRPAAGTLTYTTVGGNAAGETPAFSGALSYASTLGGDPLTPDTYEDAIEAGNLALADNDAFLAGNYTLAVLTGDIVVSDGSFTVGLEGESWPYDGDPHGPTLTGSEPGDEVTYYTYDGSSWVPYGPTPPTVTNVADGPLQVKVVVTRPGYEPAEATTTLTITPADMDVDSSGYDQPYDGNAHGITVTGPDGSTVKYSLTQSSDPADYTLDESPTATDYTPGTPVYFVVTDDNYNPAFGSETITIGKRTIRVTTNSDSKPYDTLPLTNDGWTEDNDSDGFVAGEGFDPANTSATGSITNVGSTANPFDYALLAGTNPDNYAVDATEGTLTITRATDMVVTADDYSGKYDGAPHGVTAGVEVGGTTTILYSESWSSDPADYTLTGSPTLTHVGTKTVYFVALNDNYEPDFGSAQITVAPREITLTAATRTMQYDGQPLENSTVTLSGDGFVDGEGFATWPTATGSITNVGNTANVVGDGTLNTSTEAADYDFTPVDGTLTVTPAVLTVQADTLNLTYPESRPAAGTLTYTTVGGNAAGETPAFSGALSYASTLGGDPLTPDTYEDAIEAGNLALADNDAFLAGNYTLAVLTGDIVVSDGSFTVGLEGESWPYDGDPHGPTLTGSEPGDEVTYYTYDGSSWVPYGPTPPTVTNVADGPLQVKVVVTRPGYEPAEATTTLTITPADMDVDSSGYDQPYDGNAHGITVTGPDGSTVKYSLTQSSDPADYTLDESPTATDYTPGTPVYFVVTDDNYNPAFGSETITIGKRTIRVTTNSDSKPYDTLPLTNDGWTEDNDSDGFVAGEGFDPANTSATGSITNVGSTANPFDYALLAGTNPDNYAVDATEGTLTITRATDMVVTADDYSGKYDGAPHGVTAGVEVGGTTTILYSESWSSDPADYTLTGSPTLTHVGTKTVYFVALNDNYEPDFGSAQITVAPREITLTAATRTMQYDGQPLENSTVTLSGDGFVDGEGFATWPTATGSITNVGNTANVVGDGTLNTSTEAADYDFTPVDGTLTVTPAVLTVQADTLNLTYPESRPAAGTLTYTTVGGNAAGETPAFSGALSYASTLGGDPLTPDTYEDAIEAGNLALADNDAFLAGNYTLAVLTGDIVVSDGSFTVGLEGESWPYDGDPHGPTLTGSEPGDEVTYYTYDGSSWVPYGPTPPTVTNVADGPLQVKVVVTRPGYEPAEATTTLTITPADMDVDSSGYDQPYDGNAHGITVTGPDGSTVKYSLTQSSDPADYTLDESPTATDYTPGTPVYFVVTDDNYNPAFGSETITIGKRTIRVTTNSDSKPYDTLPLTNDGWTEDNDSDGFVAGEGFDPANTSATGSITNVGSTANPFDYALLAGTNPDNYAVDATEGTLTITRATDMVVTADDYSGKYDGAPHGVTAGVEVGGTTTILYSESWSSDPADYTLTGSPTLTHVGTKTVYFVALNDNYEPDFGSAQITVAPREITVNTSGATKVYDGEPLTQSGWSISAASDGFISGEGFATASATGTITNAGSADNTFAYTFGATQSGDYSVTVLPGTLTVTQRAVLVSALDASKNYGAADPAFDYTYTTGMVEGTTYYPVVTADLSLITVTVQRTNSDNNVGVYPDVLVPGVVATPAALNNYTFATATADFTVDPRVTYITNTASTVTGFPETEWFDYGTDAVVANAAGVARTGYILTGWRDAATNEPVDLGGTIPAIDRNYALNAVWVRASYSLSYETGTTAPVLYMPANQTGVYAGDTITISAETPYYSGYRFLYWSTNDIDGTETTFNPGDSFAMPGNGVTLTAVWKAATSPIYYHPNGAEGVTIEEGRYPTDSDVTIAANPFTRDGYRFIGWSEASPTAGVSRQPGDLISMPPRQLNFYAQWEEGEEALYTVTYIVNGGTGDLDGGAYMTFTGLAVGDPMPVPVDPELEGYAFDGWAGDIPATVPGEDVVIYGTMTLIERPIEVPEEEPEVIPEEQTPLAGGPVWALLNLILAVATALVSIWMLLGLIGRKKDVEDGVVTPETQRRQGVARVLTLLPGIGGIILFLLTENMNNPMVFTDRWTIYMIVIAAVQLLLLVFGVTKGKDKDPDKDDTNKKEWTYDILKGV